MRIKPLNEIKNKRPVNSEKRYNTPHENVPDEENRETCLNCPLPKCKPRCGLLKVRYPQ